MKSFLHKFFLILLCFAALTSYAQEGVRTPDAKKETPAKLMIVPFEPKLYMSDIDQKVNKQTKWSFDMIRENFRHQLDSQLKLKLQSIMPVLSFYSDSAKMSKDLQYIYNSTTLSFENVTPSKTPEKKEQGIKNGQLSVEVNQMLNTRIPV